MIGVNGVEFDSDNRMDAIRLFSAGYHNIYRTTTFDVHENM
jgi:hypothetical protein